MKDSVYLDYNATTPIDPEVAEAMLPYLHGHFGNPSSSHPYGRRARQAVDHARAQVAGLIGCDPDEVIFTSGGTESNNYAIKGTALLRNPREVHIITSAVEHPAVIEVCRWLEDQGASITVLPVDEYGMVSPDDVQAKLTGETALISIMHANNEVGTLQPIPEMTRIARQNGVLFHTDAAQSIGKVRVDVNELGVDLLSIAGHKVYAPKGIGALFIRRGVRLEKFMHGAGHEFGLRAGTENVLQIVGLGKACEIAARDLDKNEAHFITMRERLFAGLRAGAGDAMRMNGHADQRLPNTLSLSFRGVQANRLLDKIDEQVAASAGAACHADDVQVSAVLEAMGVPLDWGMGTIRFSVGRGTTLEEIDRAVAVILSAVNQLRAGS